MAFVINASKLGEQAEEVLTRLWLVDEPLFIRFKGKVRGKLVKPTPAELAKVRSELEADDVPIRALTTSRLFGRSLVHLVWVADRKLYVVYLNYVKQQALRGGLSELEALKAGLQALGFKPEVISWEQQVMGWPPNNLYTAGLV